MKTKNLYDITLLNDDLLLLTYPTYDTSAYTSPPSSGPDEDPTSKKLVQSILDRIYRKENEMPYLFLQWAE